MLSTLAVAGYRSLRDLQLPLGPLNVITGANGSGKSSLYRALRLLADCARGGLIPSLAREGGLQSTLWAGPEQLARSVLKGQHPVQGTRRRHPVALKLGFAGDEFGYAVELGLPLPSGSAFALDPVIKRECLWAGPRLRPAAVLVERHNAVVQCREDDGGWRTLSSSLASFDSMLAHCADPLNAPELLQLREQIRGWRFYDHFRTDAAAAARQPQVGTHTPALAHDGADLAAALQTIREIGDGEALERAIDDAFPGSSLAIEHADGRFALKLHQHGLLRPLDAAELSDGTLRYLLWVAALLTPRPPGLMVLNEPETSLHPDLLPALGRRIAAATEHSQLVVVTHAPRLLAALEAAADCNSLVLDKCFGETLVPGAEALLASPWRWPAR